MNRDINIILTILADGYDVNIEINGIDVGIRGRKSESIKLFGKENPNLPVLPDDMKRHICLQEGDNTISARYKCVNPDASADLSIELQAREQFVNGANFFTKKIKPAVGEEGKFSDIFTI